MGNYSSSVNNNRANHSRRYAGERQEQSDAASKKQEKNTLNKEIRNLRVSVQSNRYSSTVREEDTSITDIEPESFVQDQVPAAAPDDIDALLDKIAGKESTVASLQDQITRDTSVKPSLFNDEPGEISPKLREDLRKMESVFKGVIKQDGTHRGPQSTVELQVYYYEEGDDNSRFSQRLIKVWYPPDIAREIIDNDSTLHENDKKIYDRIPKNTNKKYRGLTEKERFNKANETINNVYKELDKNKPGKTESLEALNSLKNGLIAFDAHYAALLNNYENFSADKKAGLPPRNQLIEYRIELNKKWSELDRRILETSLTQN